MTTPFSGEDLVKRSFFSSIINLRINKPNKNVQQPTAPAPNPWETFDEQQPCSTWQLQHHDQQRADHDFGTRLTHAAEHRTPPPQRLRALSRQLEDTLYLASTPDSRLMFDSPHEIYEEIMCECAPFEQFPSSQQAPALSTGASRHQQSTEWMPESFPQSITQSKVVHQESLPERDKTQQPRSYVQLQPTSLASAPTDQRPFSDSPKTVGQPSCEPMVCPNCMHTITPVSLSVSTEQHGARERPFVSRQNANSDRCAVESSPGSLNFTHHQHQSQLRSLLGSGGVSLEELVKLIVSTVKDTARQSTSPTPVQSPSSTAGMSPAEILQRKRQQNNEAAARYRKRQKEAKTTKSEEIEQLTERNLELRAQIAGIYDEMRQLRAQLRQS